MYQNPTLNESTTTLQFGQVVGVKKGYVKVQIVDMDNFVTDWLPFAISGDTQDNKNYMMPSMGCQVSLLLDARGERGTVLGSIYSDVDSTESPNESANHNTYKDGAVIEYDPESSTLKATGIKDADIQGTGNLTAEFDGDIHAKGQSITLESNSNIILQAPEAIYLNTPMTVIAGGLTAGGATGRSLRSSFRATFNIPVDFISPAIFYNFVDFKVSPIIKNISYEDHTHKTPSGESDPPTE